MSNMIGNTCISLYKYGIFFVFKRFVEVESCNFNFPFLYLCMKKMNPVYFVYDLESVNENCPLPTADQVKILEEYVSTRNYNLTILQPKIYLLAAEHPQRNVRKKHHTSRTDRVRISCFFFNTISFFSFNILAIKGGKKRWLFE